MVIAVKCISCDWKGKAEVSHRKGLKLQDQECPICSSDIKRASGRHYGEWAEIKKYIRERNGH